MFARCEIIRSGLKRFAMRLEGSVSEYFVYELVDDLGWSIGNSRRNFEK